ncbi:helix-turn-helix domain-containing protein [Scatolibacter rhodanostii]|uniref:helix-turn-helix domain-containing protein n=1 Tax=Scatolibacter rhodanostii TaxID=2014781 RepID=UPI000C07B469|nr:helix-turn-helix domain-containing protein [Scatolibacter rhodanostii]
MTYHNTSTAVLQCSPRAATLLKFLMEKANNLTHSSFWRIPKIIAQCGFSRSTYHRAIRELVKAGFVTVKERAERCGRQMSNEYIIHLPKETTPLDKTHHQGTATPKIKVSGHVKLSGMAYKIYLYLQAKCGHKGYCVSRREIAAACNISLSTVSRYIRKLQSMGYIACRPDFKENNGQGYHFLSVKLPAKIKLLHMAAFIQVFSYFFDTLPLITADTPRTISKFKLINSKVKRKFSYLVTKNVSAYKHKIILLRRKIHHRICRYLN